MIKLFLFYALQIESALETCSSDTACQNLPNEVRSFIFIKAVKVFQLFLELYHKLHLKYAAKKFRGPSIKKSPVYIPLRQLGIDSSFHSNTVL